MLGLALIASAPAASSATTAGVEALNESLGGPYNEERHFWSPTPVEVTTSGGAVTFTNSSAAVPHGVIWENAPATPTCEEGAGKVPVGLGHFGYSWKGTCTFSKEGVYNYYCSVHGRAMSGTVYVNANGTIPPTPTTGEATPITEIGATLRGTVNPSSQATSYFFQYGTTAAYGAGSTEQSVGADGIDHAVSAPIGELTPGVLYHFRLVATFASGQSSVQGVDHTFTTLSPPGPPTATTGQASAIGETGATLAGTVNPGAQTTTYSFHYGLTTAYGLSSPELSTVADRSNHTVSAPLTGLAPGTVYHYELLAHNASGPATGVDRTFTTASPPPPTGETPPSQPPTQGPSGTSLGTPSAFTPLPPAGPVALGGSPLAAGAHALTLAPSQHSQSVHGSVDVSPAGAGGRLEVAVFATGASLAAVHRPAGVRVGRLVRSSVHAGVVSFTAPLTARGRAALRRHHRLALTVRIVLTPLAGAPASVTRSVVLRG
jgi:plastocyanin